MKRILQATMAAITVAMTSITTTPAKADSHFSYRTLIADAGRSLPAHPEGLARPEIPVELRQMLIDRLPESRRSQIDVFVIDLTPPARAA